MTKRLSSTDLQQLASEASAEVTRNEAAWETDPTDARWALVRDARDKRDQLLVRMAAAAKREAEEAAKGAAAARAADVAKLKELDAAADPEALVKRLGVRAQAVSDAREVVRAAVNDGTTDIVAQHDACKEAAAMEAKLGLPVRERVRLHQSQFKRLVQIANARADLASGQRAVLDEWIATAHHLAPSVAS